MARPLVLGKTDHPTIWTPVYADITDPKMTDWLWEQRECEEQKERFFRYRRDKKFFISDHHDRRFSHKKKHHDSHDDVREYQLMTSVSIPVFDRRENAVSRRAKTHTSNNSSFDREMHLDTWNSRFLRRVLMLTDSTDIHLYS